MIILGTNSIKDTGFNVANSCRFNDGSSDHLTRNFAQAGNRKTFTISVWIKQSFVSTTEGPWIMGAGADGSNSDDLFLHTGRLQRSAYYGSQAFILRTSAKFRDLSAWSHFVIRSDTTQSTASNRMRIYVNGELQTAFDNESYPDEDFETTYFNTARVHSIGSLVYGSTFANFFDGYMSEFCFIDGTSLDATSFGEFDEDSGIWKPIDVSGLTFGTNGFYLDFQDSAALGDDVSGNGNDFTVNNLTAIDQSTDTCTNNFATLNGLDYWSGSTASLSSFLSEGNLDFNVGSSAKSLVRSTIGVTTGKWYWEVKNNTVSKGFYGMCNANALDGSTAPHDGSDFRGIFYYDAVPDFRANSGDGAITTGISSVTNGDILNFALDMDNYAFYIGKNGTWMNSGNPNSGASKTGAISELFTNGSTYLSDYGEVFACLYCSSTSGSIDASTNFGSPSFTISSGNTDGNGYGNFEYAVPSGYYSLNSKNLSEFG